MSPALPSRKWCVPSFPQLSPRLPFPGIPNFRLTNPIRRSTSRESERIGNVGNEEKAAGLVGESWYFPYYQAKFERQSNGLGEKVTRLITALPNHGTIIFTGIGINSQPLGEIGVEYESASSFVVLATFAEQKATISCLATKNSSNRFVCLIYTAHWANK